MHPVYLAAPKDSPFMLGEKTKYVAIIKDKAVILNNKKYNSKNDAYSLTFKIGASNAVVLKKCINEKLSIYKVETPSKFIDLLGSEFDIKEQQELNQENNVQVTTSKLTLEDEQLIEASQSHLPTSRPRPNSLRYENVSGSYLRKTLSLHDPVRENSLDIQQPDIPSDLSSSRNSIHNQDSLDAEQDQLIERAPKIYSFFTEKAKNTPLSHIKSHGLNIQKGYFNGGVKSKILLDITQLAEQIKSNSNEIGNESSNEQIQALKQKVSMLNEKINDKQNLEILSRYRGFSAFKCFATLWGGGRVKSIEYVEQLQEQVASLLKEITPLRPTV
ncbi:hypothetical protein [Rickettsiella endosymbiont of Litargus connexus]|jgi:hypothetical protein|uniref:hypothetical protein n=1 Tax=Rickettsiella endosymbiont of Litargus connexus TaxID=3066237 RepID=UPI00376F0BD2